MKKAIPIITALAIAGGGTATGLLTRYLVTEFGIQKAAGDTTYVCVSISSPNDTSVLFVGDTLQLNARVTRNGSETGIDQSVVWSSDNYDVATIDNAGLVNTYTAGSVTFKAVTLTESFNAPEDVGMATYTINVFAAYDESGYQVSVATHLPYEGAPEGVSINGVTDPQLDFAQILYIPSTIGGKPVYELGNNALSSLSFLRELHLPEGICYIGEGAFQLCASLEKLYLPASITDFYTDSLLDATGLKSIEVAPGGTKIKSIDGVLFSADGTNLIRYPAAATATTYTIPDSVETIALGAFQNCKYLESVNMPNTVYAMETYVFAYCFALQTVQLSTNLTNIPQGTFIYAIALNTISIPSSVETIDSQAFMYCSALQSVTFTSGLLSIADQAFAFCPALTSVTFPFGLTDIGAIAFAYCSALESIELPTTILNIDDGAFGECDALSVVDLPASLESMGDSVFAMTDGLEAVNVDPGNTIYTSIDGVLYEDDTKLLLYPPKRNGNAFTIPTNVTEIAPLAFYGAKYLETLSIPAATTAIDFQGFEMALNLKTIDINATNANYRSMNGVAFDIGMTTLYAYPCAKPDTTYTVPTGVTKIDYSAFQGNKYLQVINLSTVSLIEANALSKMPNLTSINFTDSMLNVGEYVFSECPKIVSVNIPASVIGIGRFTFSLNPMLSNISVDGDNPRYSSDNGVLYDDEQLRLLAYPAARPNYSYVIKEGINSIAVQAIYGTKYLAQLSMPTSMRVLFEDSVSNNQSLERITFTDGILSNVTGDAFKNNAAMQEYVVDTNNPSYFSDNGVLYAKDGTTELLISYPAGRSAKSYTMRNTTYAIGPNAFDGAMNLLTVEIAKTTTLIAAAAFNGCNGLEYLVIPRATCLVAADAFANCSAALFFESASIAGGISGGFNPDNNPVYMSDEWYYADYVPHAK